jgi:hypothetical protein
MLHASRNESARAGATAAGGRHGTRCRWRRCSAVLKPVLNCDSRRSLRLPLPPPPAPPAPCCRRRRRRRCLFVTPRLGSCCLPGHCSCWVHARGAGLWYVVCAVAAEGRFCAWVVGFDVDARQWRPFKESSGTGNREHAHDVLPAPGSSVTGLGLRLCTPCCAYIKCPQICSFVQRHKPLIDNKCQCVYAALYAALAKGPTLFYWGLWGQDQAPGAHV